MACLLSAYGCEVTTAASGAEAFHAFEQGLRPCMMLLDLRMPDMDGWEVWDRMREHHELRETPVVIVSGEPPDPARARAVGIRALLQKPRRATEIVAVVEQHCRLAQRSPWTAGRTRETEVRCILCDGAMRVGGPVPAASEDPAAVCASCRALSEAEKRALRAEARQRRRA